LAPENELSSSSADNGTDWQELGVRAVNYGVDVGQAANVVFDQDANPFQADIASTGDNDGLYVKRLKASSWLGADKSMGKVRGRQSVRLAWR
jgi:hypothetical protein